MAQTIRDAELVDSAGQTVFETCRLEVKIRHRDDWLEDRALGYNRRFLVLCNKLQTFCEQSATVFAARRGVQQFVNKVQTIACSLRSEDISQTAKNPVVEHKGSSDDVVDFVF